MGLITYDKIPVGLLELDLHILVAAQFVEPGNEKRDLLEGVPCAGSLETIIGQDLEGEVKPTVEFILPLVHEVSRAHDHTAIQITPDHQFFDEEAGHDGFSCPRVISEEVAERLPGDHLFVDSGNLMG